MNIQSPSLAVSARHSSPTPQSLWSRMGLQLARGSMFGLTGQAVALLASLIATPIVIRLLGSELYGVLTLVNTVVGYMAFADIGMGSASTRFGSQAYALGDEATEASVIWTSLLISALPALILALLLMVGAKPLVEQALRLPDRLHYIAIPALQVASIGLIARSIAGVLNTPQLVRLRLGLFTAINSGGGVAQIGLVPVVLLLGGGLLAAVGAVVGVAVVVMILHGIAAVYLLPGVIQPRIRTELIGPLFHFGAGVVGTSLAWIVLFSSEKLLLTRLVSVVALAHYSVAFSLSWFLGTLLLVVGQPIMSAFSRLQAAPDRTDLYRLYTATQRIVFLGVVPGAVLLCIWAKPFFTVWAGPEYGQESVVPFYILMAGFVLNALTFAPSYLLTAFGKTNIIAYCQWAELGPYLLCAAVLIQAFGVTGAALAWLFRSALDALLIFIAARQVSGFSSLSWVERPYNYLAASIAILLPVLLLWTPTPQVIVRIFASGAALSAYSVVVWKRVLASDERGRIVSLVNMAWRRSEASHPTPTGG